MISIEKNIYEILFNYSSNKSVLLYLIIIIIKLRIKK